MQKLLSYGDLEKTSIGCFISVICSALESNQHKVVVAYSGLARVKYDDASNHKVVAHILT